jgi:peroxiredoxin
VKLSNLELELLASCLIARAIITDQHLAQSRQLEIHMDPRISAQDQAYAGHNGETLEHLPSPGDRLPKLDLPQAPQGTAFDLPRMGRESRILFFSHGTGCAACRTYLEGLLSKSREFEDWDSKIIAVLPVDLEEANRLYQQLASEFPVLADPGGAARTRFGIAEGEVGIFVADRYGVIWYTDRAREATGLPQPEEMETRARFLAVQCPECGVPDQPVHGEWGWSR